MISVKSFKPTPYRDCDWEIVGEPMDNIGFSPMSLAYVEGQEACLDPMFEDFDAGQKRYKSNKNVAEHTKKKEPSAPGIDPQIHQTELAASYERGKQEGIETGRSEAIAEYEAERNDLKEKMLELSRQIADNSHKTFVRIEKEAVQLALAVARKILITTADVKPDYIFTVIREGIKRLGAARPVRIRTSPQDFEFIEVIGLPAEISSEELGVEYVADESIKSGCVIETNFGMVDLELEKMWEQVREQLYESYR